MRYVLAVALVATTAFGGVAIAAKNPTTKIRADANSDGAISRAEFLRHAEARFAKLDRDGNTLLTRDERRAGRGVAKHQGAVGGPFESVAQDQMGAPPAGTPPRGGAMMKRFDADGDGKLSKAEFAAQAAQRWQRMDANGNGTLETTERGTGRAMAAITDRASFDKQTDERFARMDGNGDGFIDATEASAMAGGMRQGRRANRRAAPAATPTPVITTAPTPSGN